MIKRQKDLDLDSMGFVFVLKNPLINFKSRNKVKSRQLLGTR